MTSIVQALGAGYSAKHILKYLSKQNPQLAQQITAALNAGHTIDHVLNFISRHQKKIGKLIPEKREVNPASNLYKTAQNQVHPSLTNMAKLAGTTALAAAGTYALSRSAPQLLQRIQGLPKQQAGLAHGAQNPIASAQLPSQAAGMQQQAPNNISTPQQTQQPPTNQVAGNIAQPAQPQQPKGIINPKEYLEKKGILEQVNDSLKRGNNPEQVAAELGIKRTGKSQLDPELLSNIEAYAQEKQAAPQEQKMLEPEGQKLDVSKETPEIKPISKNQTVASPQGVGEVKEIRNGKALVDVDGKLHKVDAEDLDESPLPEKDLADLYDELIHGIESETGEDVSRMVQWAGYNPTTNTLQFLPHTGKLYTYSDISSEDAALLRDILSVRKTSGENFIGAWKKDSKSPIGAALSKLIKKLQGERGGKGNEYEASYEPVYSAYEPAIQAKKKKRKK